MHVTLSSLCMLRSIWHPISNSNAVSLKYCLDKISWVIPEMKPKYSSSSCLQENSIDKMYIPDCALPFIHFNSIFLEFNICDMFYW